MNQGQTEIHIRSTPDEATQFFERLMTEGDPLRSKLEEGGEATIAALAEHGITVSPELLPDDPKLPSTEEIKMALDAVDRGVMSACDAQFRFMKFWPVFWAMIRFRRP
jgi:hypothetical protein